MKQSNKETPHIANQLSEAALSQLHTINEADRIFGTYHPETLDARRRLLELRFRALVEANSPLEFFKHSVKDAIKDTIADGFESIIDSAKLANHPMIQSIREEL